jgi:hypothetical protein
MSDAEYEEFIRSIPPENWHCQKCAGPFVFDGNSYACDRCEMMWPAAHIVQFGYADLTRE